MADLKPDNKSISKLNTGFPDYLDWEKLRAAGLEHLGNLSGKIWTDHNVHDPGITILEMLCYAIMDLGYRTNLPAADIFARRPDDTSPDNNFFTPSQILACNPVTITDFRKLLIDLDGVKNAWLEDSFYSSGCTDPNHVSFAETSCSGCYNGLYRVYIEAEPGFDPGINEENEKHTELVKKISDSLMAHRNLCEDFIDIRFLCKEKIGLCADIELQTDADEEEVYQDMVDNLRNFFSPSPKFYTLKYLLEDRKKTIDEIFAGRPYDTAESHGFVDTEEFEMIKLKKELHLSDLYQVILDTPGVSTVTNLGWKKNCGTKNSKVDKSWIWKIPKDHVPDFSTSCSVFRFTRNNIPLKVDFQKFSELLEMGFTQTGKMLYKKSSPYLEADMPKGIYRADLGEYQSIQNEFPRVYGINRGGLPDDVPVKRKAQALQLKSYLLFFDQLLANYLAQLNNIRSLFSFSGPAKKDGAHTYFLNQLSDVPELDRLLRFPVEGAADNILGSEGNLLAIPVKRKWMEDLVRNASVKESDLYDDVHTAVFRDRNACDIALNGLHQDLFYGDYPAKTGQTISGCWFFYFITSSEEIVLIGNKFYTSKDKAIEASDAVKYAAAYLANYHTFINASNRFSFTLELRLFGYNQYLQGLGEDKFLYQKRRQQFLDHLLSRFAERFTDFALLSFGFLKEDKLIVKEIQQKERFLTNYSEWSSTRGKGYDYRLDGWNNENLSGFEKRSFALAGVDEIKRHHLCNFVVEPYEEYFEISVKLDDGTELFNPTGKFYSREAAEDAANMLIQSLKEKGNYEADYDEAMFSYRIKVNYGKERQVIYCRYFESQAEALKTAYGLFKLFSFEPVQKDEVHISKMVYKAVLRDHQMNEVAVGNTAFEDYADAAEYLRQVGDLVRGKESWQFTGDKPDWFGEAYSHFRAPGEPAISNILAFKYDIDDTIVKHPDKFKYELLDVKNNFKFYSARIYDDKVSAESACRELVALLSSPDNYYPVYNDRFGKHELHIRHEGMLLATTDPYFDSGDYAGKMRDDIIDLVKKHQYLLFIEQRPSGWDFRYLLGFDFDKQYLFKSKEEYPNPDLAYMAAKKFYASITGIQLARTEQGITLQADAEHDNLVCDLMQHEETAEKDLQELLRLKKEIYTATGIPETEGYKQYIHSGIEDPESKHLYRLVDKDHLYAFHKPAVVLNTRDKADTLKKEIFQNPFAYQYTDVFLGNECIKERKNEKTNIISYHYQVVCKPGCVKPGVPTVLFESIKGYETGELALQEFDKNLMEIFAMGMNPVNYGEDKFIAIQPLADDTTCRCDTSSGIVYIADDIKELFKWKPDADLINELVKISKQYPFRYALKEDDSFYDLFPCEPDKRIKTSRPVCGTEMDPEKFYYYVLYDNDGNEIWQSVDYFTTLQETVQQFNFFLLLLRYPGNYCIQQDYCGCKTNNNDPCVCGWKIYVREVLAESKKRFATKEQAWEGVEEFICVSQTADSFHTYLESKTCYYTFDVSCNNSGLVHPCKYDTIEKRNGAIAKLFRPFKAGWSFPSICYKNPEKAVLRNTAGEDLAYVDNSYFTPVAGKDCVYCLGEFIEKIQKGKLKTDGTDYWLADGNKKLAWPEDVNKQSAEQWRNSLLKIACYYPVIKLGDDKFKVGIRLPGFDCCDKGEVAAKEDKHKPFHCSCCIAWESECCFKSCEEAFDFLDKMKEALSDPSHYQPVFDCECGPYGIRLICSCKEKKADNKDIVPQRKDKDPNARCCNEIIAFNPQWYTHPRMDCEAVKRAKKLINAEGFHLVEHILLRPRCEEDCIKSSGWCRIPVCATDKLTCEDWKWKPTGEKDPCDIAQKEIEFKPAHDPYSFIATVALPAWPERFRKKDNRLVIENLLYQEAPAHILLRVIWLSPRDFCRFESHFKKWNLWISRDYSHKCLDKDPTCDFIEFLFNQEFATLPECQECIPCIDETTEDIPCFTAEADPCSDWSFQKNISELFCWNPIYGRNPIRTMANRKQPVEPVDTQITGEQLTNSETTEKGEGKISKAKINFFNRRKGLYSKQVEDIITNTNHNRLAEEAKIFVSDPVDIRKYFQLSDAILQNEKKDTRQGKKFTPNQQQILFSNMTWSILDRFAFTGIIDGENIEPLKSFFRNKRTEGIDPDEILREWSQAGLGKHSTGTIEETIREILTDKKR